MIAIAVLNKCILYTDCSSFSGSRCSPQINYYLFVCAWCMCVRQMCIYFHTPLLCDFAEHQQNMHIWNFNRRCYNDVFSRSHIYFENWVQCLLRWTKKNSKREQECVASMLDGCRFAFYFKHFSVWPQIISLDAKKKTKIRAARSTKCAKTNADCGSVYATEAHTIYVWLLFRCFRCAILNCGADPNVYKRTRAHTIFIDFFL